MKRKRIPISITLSENVIQYLDIIGWVHGRNRSNMVEAIIREYAEDHGDNLKEYGETEDAD